MSVTINSKNPANSTLAGTFSETWDKFVSQLDDCLPAVVVSYDRATNTANVRPIIQRLRTDGTVLSRPQINNVHCFAFGSSIGVLAFNLKPGDLGWLKASDRDISIFIESLAESPPQTLRKHNFSDAFFIPDSLADWTIDSSDNASLVLLQTTDATQRIVLFEDRIKLASNNLVTIDAPTTNTTGATNLGNTGGSPGIARLGDSVQVTIPIGSIGGSENLPTSPVVVSGTITSASSTNTAS